MAGEGTTKTTWPVLDANERRVLGVLIEKAKTTPDSYPLTINALVSGCNQKSARDPVMDLNDLDVEDTLARLQKKGLVVRVTGTRADRFRHELYTAWQMDSADLALVGELLLRGPQTEGELRSHASRMATFDDMDAMRNTLKPLVERGLVLYLAPQGKRGTTLTHGFHPPAELERLKQRASRDEGLSTPVASPPPVAAVPPEWEQRWQQAQAEIARLSQELAQTRASLAELQQKVSALAGMQQTLAALSQQVDSIKQGLGL